MNVHDCRPFLAEDDDHCLLWTKLAFGRRGILDGNARHFRDGEDAMATLGTPGLPEPSLFVLDADLPCGGGSWFSKRSGRSTP